MTGLTSRKTGGLLALRASRVKAARNLGASFLVKKQIHALFFLRDSEIRTPLRLGEL